MKLNNKHFLKYAGVIPFSLASLVASQYVSAQSVLLEEIIVTAQKREQSLQDVAISVTAFSGDAIDQLGFQSSTDIVNQTPGLIFTEEGSNSFLALRGNLSLDFGDGNESPVGFYVDEVYRSSLGGQNNQLFDLERVEVLRGPQGTLYGRNTTAGLVHYISRKPTEEFEGYVDFQVGSFGQTVFEGAVSGSLTEGVRGRLSAKYNADDGWQENQVGDDFSETDVSAVRGQLEFDLTEEATFLLSVSHSDQDNTSAGYGFQGVLDPLTGLQCSVAQVNGGQCVNLAGFQDPEQDPENIFSELRNPKSTAEIQGVIGKLNWQLADNIALVSITAYEEVDRSNEVDEDSSATGAFGGFLQFHDFYTVNTEAFTQEFRLSGNFQDRYEWVMGAFYFDETKRPTSTVTALEFPAGTPDTASIIETTSWALFGNVEAKLTGELSLVVGLRYTEDERDAAITTGGVTNTPSLTTEGVTGNLGLNWNATDDLLLYVSYSRGFKSGDFATTLLFGDALGAVAVEEEIVDQIELGAKLGFWEGKGRFNASIFYQDIQDKQGTVNTVPGQATTVLTSIGDVDVYGGEFELSVQPIEALEVSLGIALLDTEIQAGPAVGGPFNFGTGANAGLGDFVAFDGAPLSQAADITVNGVVRYSFDHGDHGNSTLQVDYSWTDDKDNANPYFVIDSYSLVNLRAFWESSTGRYNASVFVENVGDETVELGNFWLPGFDYKSTLYGRPRWYGAKVGMKF